MTFNHVVLIGLAIGAALIVVGIVASACGPVALIGEGDNPMHTYKITAANYLTGRYITKLITVNSEEHALRVATAELGDWGYVVDIKREGVAA